MKTANKTFNMEIRMEELAGFEKLIQQKLGSGYRWMLYEENGSVLDPEKIMLFKKFSDAEKAAQNIVLLESVHECLKKEMVKSVSGPGIEIDFDIIAVLNIKLAFYQRRAEVLAASLTQWGIPDDLTPVFEKALNEDTQSSVLLEASAVIKGQKMNSTIFVEQGPGGLYEFDKFSCSLARKIEIPDLYIHGIDCRKLDKQMNVALGRDTQVLLSLISGDLDRNIVDAVISFGIKLDELSQSAAGREVAELLMAKYYLGTPMESVIPDPERLDKKYVIRQNFDKIGETLFTLAEAYNLMCERYVSKTCEQDGRLIRPWYYRHNGLGPNFSNLVQVANSESLDINKHVERLVADGFLLGVPADKFEQQIRRGDELTIELVRDGYKQAYTGYFNPFLNEMELNKAGPRLKIDQSKDLGNDLGKGRQI